MAVDSSLVDALALNFISGVGVITQRNLIDHFGSPKAVIEASSGELQSISGVGKRISSKILNEKSAAYERAEKEIVFADRHQIRILPFSDDAYPRRLKQCADAPMLIYYRGNANLDSMKIVSIVGTRNATSYGRDRCKELVGGLSAYDDVLVVSGLAYGIDSYVHKLSVENSIPTVGVLGHGLDQIYPNQNRSLAVKMLENGGLLSEYSSGTRPDRQNFPQRNRIIAGLADVVIVVEAAIRGGALITAEIANTYNRDVCAFPGNVNSEYSSGCNFLIKSHRAHLITKAEDLGYLMDWQLSDEKSISSQLELALSLSDSEKFIYKIIQEQNIVSVDKIGLLADEKQSKLAIVLLELEMKGLIIAMPGKIYRCI